MVGNIGGNIGMWLGLSFMDWLVLGGFLYKKCCRGGNSDRREREKARMEGRF